MNFAVPDFAPAVAEIFVATMSLVMILVGAFARTNGRSYCYLLAQGTLLVAALLTIVGLSGEVTYTFSGMFVADLLSDFLTLLILFTVGVGLVYGRGYLAARGMDRPEFYLLTVLMTLGMMVMVSAAHMLPLYIGLEMMSLSLYGMVAFDRDSARSTEAAMKYFVLGALASGLLLYGMSMVYGATGALDFVSISAALTDGGANELVLTFGLVFLMAGIAFKLGVVPFHMWVPDVYQGAPTAVTLMIATAPKLAALAMALRLLVFGLFALADAWQDMLIVLAVASIVLGNVAAIAQTNFKRMLAYSGISHMGFVLLGMLSGVVDGNPQQAIVAYSSALFYAVAYVLMSLAAFGMILLLSRAGFEAEEIDDYRGLNQRSPWYAGLMLMVMFSMAGVPFFVGFFAKFAVLQAVVASGMVWLAVLAVMMSLIGAFYYLRIVKVMYFDDAVDTSPIETTPEVHVLLSVNGIAIAVLGLLPQGLMYLCGVAMLASLV